MGSPAQQVAPVQLVFPWQGSATGPRPVRPHLPAEEAPGSPPLGQLMGRLAGRVAAALWRII